MDLSLSFRIARTHLFTRKKQTIIASLGVMFGIAMFIVMISFMTGVNQFVEESTLTASPHIRIYHDVDARRPSLLDEHFGEGWNIVHHQKPKDELLNLKNGLMIAEEIKKRPEVLGVSPQLTSQVFFNYGPIQLPGQLVGVNIPDEDRLYDVRSRIKSGSMEALMASNDGILMGKGLADKLNVKVGDKLTVTTPTGGTLLVRIVGTFQFGMGQIDNIKCYTNITTVQKILQKDTRYVTDLHIKLKDIDQAKKLAPEFQKTYRYKSEDWETANSTIMASFVIRNVMTYVVVCTLLVVAGFGIYNIMNMTVYDKIKDIAILKATGFEGGDIVAIFLSQAVFIGVMGGLAGLSLGFFLSYLISQTPFDGGEFMSLDTFPVNFNPLYYINGFLFGVVTTLLAGYFPASKASKIDPVAILRG